VFGTINSIYINTIGVLEEYRKHGLAKKMIEWVTDRTKKDGVFKLIYLHVIEYNTAAIKLYERLGFRHLDSFNAFYTVDEKEYKGELLGLFLNGG
jgi:ribosomal protein S18 acetylase RimI-like enzyme